MRIKSFAKINLALDVLKKSGTHHEIRTVFQQIGLHDEITFQKIAGKKIIISGNGIGLPSGGKNTIIKAADLLKRLAGQRKKLKKNITGLSIRIKKNIPVAAGLGGGSSNAAATLLALNKLWKLKLSKATLRNLASQIGMDVPFFIDGGTACGIHYGEKITKLPALKMSPIIIAINGSKASTKKLYGLIDPDLTGGKKGLTASLVRALKNKINLRNVQILFHNDFETLLQTGNMPQTKALIKLLLQAGAGVVHICGSGPAVYALFKGVRERDLACNFLRGKVKFIWRGR